jgi:hypothetical protein
MPTIAMTSTKAITTPTTVNTSIDFGFAAFAGKQHPAARGDGVQECQ